MREKYWRKLRKLAKNPGNIRYLPSFLKQEFTLWRGKKKSSINNQKCTFVTTSPSEYERVSNFKNEKDNIEKIYNELREDEVFYDIGANIGTHSCFAGKTGALVYGFEPLPENMKSLRKNFKLNNIDGEVFEVALMKENSEMMLDEESGEAGEGKVSVSEEGSVRTQVYRGDDFIEKKKLESPNVIKIDVEGAELEVLKGLEKTLEDENLRTIFIELHPKRIEKFGGNIEDLKTLLNKKEFKVTKIGNRNKEEHLKAVKQ